MFTESSSLYDYFSTYKDYPGEAAAIRAIVARLNPTATRLLDVACGTGRHLEHLQQWFSCEGADVDAAMLDVARARLPALPFTQADMTDFSLGRRFDVVTCLFSAIGYAVTIDRLHAAISQMADHLDDGGVLVFEPWVLPEAWREPGLNTVEEVDDRDRTLVRVISSIRDDNVTRLQMHHVIARHGTIETIDETHVLGLFSRDDYLDACSAAGLDARFEEGFMADRGLVVAVRNTVDGTSRHHT